jgi:tRNA A-37 threonylcarbamoyl transferase component Bud32
MDRREAVAGGDRAIVSALPSGFVVVREGPRSIYVDAMLEQDARARGLFDWDAWNLALAGGAGSSGRGASAVVSGPSGTRWRLKRMRRGGRFAGLRGDRYRSSARLIDALSVSVEALVRGVPTARPVMLLLERDFWWRFRGSMAFEEIERAHDLASFARDGQITLDDLIGAIGVVKAMHDKGILHPDLNLGNLLLRRRPGAVPEAFVIDFDRAKLKAGPLSDRARQAAVRRLERSCAKITGSPAPLGAGSEDLWYSLYAGDDRRLARRFARGRSMGRWLLAVHRLGWKRGRR